MKKSKHEKQNKGHKENIITENKRNKSEKDNNHKKATNNKHKEGSASRALGASIKKIQYVNPMM